MSMIKVSIIIPTYNVAPYIRKCLESVAAQTYTGSIECLIVDDCGPDNSIQIAEEFVQTYQGPIDFRVIHREKNGGLSAARNSGIIEATGEYLYFLDSDDYIAPNCIESMYRMVERFPGLECVFAGANVEGSNGFMFMDYTKKQLPEYSNNRDWLQESMLKRFKFSMTAWNRLISADFIRQHNLYFEEGLIHEDELWNLLISQVITKAAFVKENTYNYIIRGNSITTGVKGDYSIYFKRHFRLWNRMLDNVKGYKKGIQAYYVVIFARECLAKVSSIRDYLQFMKILVRAIIKSNGTHTIKLIYHLLAYNMYFLSLLWKRNVIQ